MMKTRESLLNMRYLVITLHEMGGKVLESELQKEMLIRMEKYPSWYMKLMSLLYPLSKSHWKSI